MRFATLVLLLVAFPALAQCPGGVCPAPSGFGGFPTVYPVQFDGPGRPQATTNKLFWGCIDGEPGWIGLWLGNDYLGKLEPFEGTWVFRDGKQSVAIREHVVRYNPPKTNTGATLPGKSLPSARPRAGVDDGPVLTIPKTGAKPADCKCGQSCECMDGHRGGDCTCGEVCRCALVNKSPRLKGKDGTPDVRDTDRGPNPKAGFDERSGGKGVPDDRRFAGPNFGVVRSDPATEQISLRGLQVSRADAFAAIGGPSPKGSGVPDDGGKRRVTIITDSPTEATRALADWNTAPELAYWRTDAIVQAYPRSAWQITGDNAAGGRGFVGPDNPADAAVYVQEADGKVIYRETKYESATTTRNGLLDADKSYVAAKDPYKGDDSTLYIVLAGVAAVVIAVGVARYRKAQA